MNSCNVCIYCKCIKGWVDLRKCFFMFEVCAYVDISVWACAHACVFAPFTVMLITPFDSGAWNEKKSVGRKQVGSHLPTNCQMIEAPQAPHWTDDHVPKSLAAVRACICACARIHNNLTFTNGGSAGSINQIFLTFIIHISPYLSDFRFCCIKMVIKVNMFLG